MNASFGPFNAMCLYGNMHGNVHDNIDGGTHLHDACVVSEVDELNPSQVSVAINPATERHLLPDIGTSQLATIVCPTRPHEPVGQEVGG